MIKILMVLTLILKLKGLLELQNLNISRTEHFMIERTK